MSSLILSQRDLEFLLYEWIDVTSLVSRPRHAEHSRETFDAALATARKVAGDWFAPHNRKADLNEPQMVETTDGPGVKLIPEVKPALDEFIRTGLLAAQHDFELGGMQLPVCVAQACMAWCMGANVATSAYPFLTIGNANLLLRHGTPEQIDTWAKPLLAGRFMGTMCLSEPQAGSSLADITTRAEPDGTGQYRLTGNKMWISAGEHALSENIVHLVLAKIPDASGKLVAGSKGISLFIVPKFLVNADGGLAERNDVVLAGLNHKMGYRGTSNCLLNFGEGRFSPQGKPGAIGYLVGEANRGLACMFTMMNEARIGVGLGATMLGYTGYLHALDYARNRPQGRHPQSKDPASPQVPIIEHTDVKRMLLAQKCYVEGALALNLYCARLVDEERTAPDETTRENATLLLDLLTPIAKSWPSQWCLAANDLAIQIHGGYGYTRDFPVEQFYRDNRLNPIHEGTHGIQALDLLGRKVTQQQGASLKLLTGVIDATLKTAANRGNADQQHYANMLGRYMKLIEQVTKTLYGANDLSKTLANATTYLEMFGHVVMGWIWLEQSLVASENRHPADASFYQGKHQACRYFFVYELPKLIPMIELLVSLDDTTLSMRDEWF